MKLSLRRDIGIFQAVEPGEGIPRGYGVAWIEPGGWTTICFPYGLHIVMRWLRLLYESVRMPRKAWWERRLIDAEAGGYERGLRVGKLVGSFEVPRIDDKHVFSRSQLNRHIAVAVDTANSIKRLPNDEAYKQGYRIGQAELMEQRKAEAQDVSDPQVRPMTKLEGILMDAQGDLGRLEIKVAGLETKIGLMERCLHEINMRATRHQRGTDEAAYLVRDLQAIEELYDALEGGDSGS